MNALLKKAVNPLFWSIITLAVAGAGSLVSSWWNAPPAEPGPAAAALVRSIHGDKGWGIEDSGLKRGDVAIVPGIWHADVTLGGKNVNEHFSGADLKAINVALKERRRALQLAGLREAAGPAPPSGGPCGLKVVRDQPQAIDGVGKVEGEGKIK